jgi:hypothetical protein
MTAKSAYKDMVLYAKIARGSAMTSDFGALRGLAREYNDAPAGTTLDDTQALAAALSINLWCTDHQMRQ